MIQRAADLQKPTPYRWLRVVTAVLAVFLLSLGTSWISTSYQSLQGWPSFLGAGLLAAASLWAGWEVLRAEAPPAWLGGLLVAAVLLRLAAGAVWFSVLPTYGYNSQAELQGYVMADAHERDQAAWKLASSDEPLLKAFQGNRKADQYGGLLFLSAMIYRLLGGDVHQPLLMVVITAAFSALAVLFTWAFTRRAWGGHTAALAAGGLAIYPEAVYLGSTQMREAFLITLAAAAFLGLLRYNQEHTWKGLAWMLAALLFSLPFSPPVTVLLLGMLILASIWLERPASGRRVLSQKKFLVLILGAGGVVLLGVWFALRQFTPGELTNPIEVVSWWLRKSADLQAYLSKDASGWIQKVFRATPVWAHMPLLMMYGVLQPFLPAAVADVTGATVWRAISIWRSLGWALLLPLLIYAPLRAFTKGGNRLGRGLSLAVWLVVLVTSYRAGGDQWDNVRYRAVFAGMQVALAAWAWNEQRRTRDPVFRWALLLVGSVLAWFVPWYLRRYIYLDWPVIDLFKTLGLGFATAVILIAWDWARSFGEDRGTGV